MDGGIEGREESNPHQRTEQWFRDREGKLTASSFGEALGLIGSRQRCFRKLTGREQFTGNPATEYGTENEPIALAAYTALTGNAVELVGFVPHPEIAWLGGSPDGLSGDVLLEIKCPFSGAVYDDVPPYYMAQAQGLLAITGQSQCHFFVWTPTHSRLFTFSRSPAYWNWMYPKLAEFWAYVQADVEPARQKKEAFGGAVAVAAVDFVV